MRRTAAITCANFSSTNSRSISLICGMRCLKSSGEARGLGTWMPLPPGMVTSIPSASAMTRMSEKRMAASRS
eukprot:scaffold2773_cov410-Prasinococcus_capsulatus_cf.AAC.12